jgi:hypothetical protein
MAYDGPERRAENIDLESRVRDLEEENRASIKSRQAMHKQLGDLNTKMDMMLSKQDEKNEACAIHKTETALLKKSQEVTADALKTHKEDTAKAIGDVEEEQIWLRRTAIGGLAFSLVALIGALWSMITGK